MKFKITRRVALRRQYEFVEIECEPVKMKDAVLAIKGLELLANEARAQEVYQSERDL